MVAAGTFAAAIALSTAPALADSPHFVGSQSCIASAGTVTCNFSVAGLGNAKTATAEIQAPFDCVKTTSHEVRPGGLASSGAQTFRVRAGRINVTNLELTASCPDHSQAEFTGPVTVLVNGQVVGTIPIT
jgi:hypothetical protein